MSFVFSGTANNFLSVSADLIIANNYTVFLYYKEAGNASTWRNIFKYANTASNDTTLRVRGNNNVPEQLINQTASAQAVVTTTVVNDVWMPVIFGSAGATNSRIQTATEDVTGGNHGAWVTNSSAVLALGADEAGAGPIAGKVAHVAIWNRELNSTERTNLLGGADPATITSGLVELWDGSSLTGANGTVLVQTGSVTTGDADDPISASNSAPVVNDQTFSVADSASNGTVIGTLVATDSDGTVDSYAISGSTLAINSTTGQITLADNTGIVAGTPITATVTVTDNNGDTDTATVTVNVTNSGLIFDCYDADNSNAAITSETLSHVRVLDPADLSEVATATNISISGAGSAEIDTDSVTIGTEYLVIARRSNGDVCEPFLVSAIDLAAP